MTDEDLMLAVRGGDLSRLAPLFERYHRQLLDYLSRMLGNQAAAEDLVQEVFVRILKYRHTFGDDSRFDTWIFRIARNARADHFKAGHRRDAALEDVEGPVDESMGVAERLERDRQAACVRRALMMLREDQRELIVLARYRDMKYEAIAELLGVEVGTVRVRMHRALNELRAIFLGLPENKRCTVKQPANNLLMA